MIDHQRDTIHDAVQSTLEDGELLTSWVLVAEVDHGNGRYLQHRAGTVTGSGPMVWTALGMLQAGVRVAEAQLRDSTVPPEGQVGGDEGDDGPLGGGG